MIFSKPSGVKWKKFESSDTIDTSGLTAHLYASGMVCKELCILEVNVYTDSASNVSIPASTGYLQAFINSKELAAFVTENQRTDPLWFACSGIQFNTSSQVNGTLPFSLGVLVPTSGNNVRIRLMPNANTIIQTYDHTKIRGDYRTTIPIYGRRVVT